MIKIFWSTLNFFKRVIIDRNNNAKLVDKNSDFKFLELTRIKMLDISDAKETLAMNL